MMLGIEDILCEFAANQEEHGFPPGFRFHPTDEELITFYLASKVFHGNHTFFPLHIAEVDLNKCEPWDLPDVAKMGKREWYFYSLRDRKYPTGVRTNRATATGYWKATGKDKEIHIAAATASAVTGALIGMKKTLVFYLGRAPRGQKTKWIMHEYRLHSHCYTRASATKEEWVICRICRKTVEKTNLVVNETGSPFDSQLTEQFLKNQANVFHEASNEDSNRASLMYSDMLQEKFGHLASIFYPTSDIGVNPSASFSSMFIKSLITNEDQNSNLMETAKNFEAETIFPYMLPGAHEFEWVHGFHHNNLDGESFTLPSYIDGTSAALEVELRGGGGLQMVMDPNFSIGC